MGITNLKIVGNINHKPASFLEDDIRVHATTVILVVEEVADVQTEGKLVPFVIGTDVEDEAGGDFLVHHQSVFDLNQLCSVFIIENLIFCTNQFL